MRYLLLAASIAALAAQGASAQSSPNFPAEMDDDIVRSLPAPEVMEDAADTVGRAAEAVLDVPVGGVVRAIDPTRPVHPDETLGDIAGRSDPYVRERIRDSVDELAIGMGDMAARVAVVAPALRRSLADLERNLDRALNGGGRGRGSDDPYYDRRGR